MTPSGIEPATFRFVAQYLNHCATGVPTTSNNVVLLISKHWRIIHMDTQESIRQCYEWKKMKSEELGT
jgi:hypothetical protein